MSEKENENGLGEQSKIVETIKKKYDRLVRYFKPEENLMVDAYNGSVEQTKSDKSTTVREVKAQKEAAIQAAEEAKSNKYKVVRRLEVKRKPQEVVAENNQENAVHTLASTSKSPEVGEDDSKKYKFIGVRRPKREAVVNIKNEKTGIDTRIPIEPNTRDINIFINNANTIERENNDRERRIKAIGSLGKFAIGSLVVLTTIGCLRSCGTSEIQEEQTIPVLPETTTTEILGAREEVQNPADIAFGVVGGTGQEETTATYVTGDAKIYDWQEQKARQETSFEIAKESEVIINAIKEAEARFASATTPEEKKAAIEELKVLDQTLVNIYVSNEQFIVDVSKDYHEAINASPDDIMDEESKRVDDMVQTYYDEMDKANRNAEFSTVVDAYLNIGVDVNVEYGENGVGVYTYEVETITQTLGMEEEPVVEQENGSVIDDSQLKDVAESRGRTFEDYARSAGETIGKVADKTYNVAKAFGEGLLDKTDDRGE